MTTLQERLLPCPFCGGEARISSNPSTYATCTKCGCDGPWNDDGNEAEAIAAWNTRAALLAAQAPGKWRPIESAPKDGTILLAWRFFPVAIKWTGDATYPWEAVHLNDADPALGMIANGFMEGDASLTHWMPLPSPPAAGGK